MKCASETYSEKKMEDEKLDARDEFLSQNGKRVYEVKEVKPRDILGIASPGTKDVSLNYVNKVNHKPTFLKLDFFPYAILKGPYVGFLVSESLEPMGWKHLPINPKYSAGRIWSPLNVTQGLSPRQQKMQREFLGGASNDPKSADFFGDKKERVYLINDGKYKDLGNLIPLVEIPSFCFLPQSQDLEELIEKIKRSKNDFETLRTTANRIKRNL